MKWISILFIFAGCISRQPDALEDITDEVLKRNKGVDIEITPEKEKR